MGWLEFTVIIVCGLLGFIVVNALIDSRRAKVEGQQKADDAKNEGNRTKQDEGAQQTRSDRQHQKEEKENPPRSWWAILNVDRNASPEQIKSAFRKEISKYHPDRVEGLGIELRELADQKAKEVNRAYALAKEQRRFN
jgi:DnaJ-domain-containing protein 1